MRNSHLPFTVSARRLAALHATLAEWTDALAPWDDSAEYFLPRLRCHLEAATRDCINGIVELHKGDSARWRIAALLQSQDVSIDKASSWGPCPRRTAQTYLASFVTEGWVRRVKPGVYALKIP